jgi:hypothetical protein
MNNTVAVFVTNPNQRSEVENIRAQALQIQLRYLRGLVKLTGSVSVMANP